MKELVKDIKNNIFMFVLIINIMWYSIFIIIKYIGGLKNMNELFIASIVYLGGGIIVFFGIVWQTAKDNRIHFSNQNLFIKDEKGELSKEHCKLTEEHNKLASKITESKFETISSIKKNAGKIDTLITFNEYFNRNNREDVITSLKSLENSFTNFGAKEKAANELISNLQTELKEKDNQIGKLNIVILEKDKIIESLNIENNQEFDLFNER